MQQRNLQEYHFGGSLAIYTLLSTITVRVAYIRQTAVCLTKKKLVLFWTKKIVKINLLFKLSLLVNKQLSFSKEVQKLTRKHTEELFNVENCLLEVTL